MDNNPKADVLASDGLSPCGSSQQAVSPVPASIPDASCTCGEVCGEDPACALHGRHTPWAIENPEPL